MSQDELSTLVNLLRSNDSGVRQKAAKKLGDFGRSATKPLIEALMDEDKFVRENAAQSLGRIGDKAVIKKLIPLLKDKYKGVRWLLSYTLAQFEDENIVKPLVESLKDEYWSVRFFTARSLGRIGDNRGLYPLINALKDERPEVRYIAAESLGLLRDRRSVDPLIELLNDENSKVRTSAVFSLGELGFIKAVEPLLKCLKHEDKETRYSAVMALGKLKDKRAIKPLIELLNDPDGEVREATVHNLVPFFNLDVLYAYYSALRDASKGVRQVVASEIIKIKNSQFLDQFEVSFRKSIRADKSKLLQLNLKMSFFWANKANAYKELGKYERSLEFFEKVMTVEPQSIETLISQAIVNLYLEDFHKALVNLEQAQHLGYENKNVADLTKEIDTVLKKEIPDLKKILEIREKLEKIRLPEITFWYRMGDYALESKEFNRAIQYFLKVIELDPQNVYSWIKMGLAYKELGNAQYALSSLDRAIEIEDIPIAWFYKASVHGVLLKDNVQSMRCLKKMLEIDPQNALALTTLVEIQNRFDNVFVDAFNVPEIKIDDKLGKIILENKEIKSELDRINQVKEKLIKSARVHKSIRLSELAEKCDYPINSIELLLEELIFEGTIRGYISDNFFIQDTMISISEFYIKNNCKNCRNFDVVSPSCTLLSDTEIYKMIEAQNYCPYFQESDKVKTTEIRNIQSYLDTIDEIKMKDLAKQFETSIVEMKGLIEDLLQQGILKGELKGSKFIPYKKIDYEQLEEFHQFISENQCAICHESTEGLETSKCNNCKANFHKDCILRYIEEHKRCPVCSSLYGWI